MKYNYLDLKTLLLLPIIFSTFKLNAQVKISGTGGTPVNAESILQLENANKGFLLTRISLQASNLPNPLSAHVAGMVVYNTATAGTNPNNVSPGLYYNDGSKWIMLTTKKPYLGDIKNGFQGSDHDGWYLLDGRALTSLPVNQRSNAGILGITTNLPNSTDRFLKNTSGSDAITSVGGADNFVLTQANLPNFNFTGTTTTNGSHTHNYSDNTATTNNVASGANNPIADTSSINTDTLPAGDHNHTFSFSLGGTNQPISLKPAYIVTNVFIYLGN